MVEEPPHGRCSRPRHHRGAEQQRSARRVRQQGDVSVTQIEDPGHLAVPRRRGERCAVPHRQRCRRGLVHPEEPSAGGVLTVGKERSVAGEGEVEHVSQSRRSGYLLRSGRLGSGRHGASEETGPVVMSPGLEVGDPRASDRPALQRVGRRIPGHPEVAGHTHRHRRSRRAPEEDAGILHAGTCQARFERDVRRRGKCWQEEAVGGLAGAGRVLTKGGEAPCSEIAGGIDAHRYLVDRGNRLRRPGGADAEEALPGAARVQAVARGEQVPAAIQGNQTGRPGQQPPARAQIVTNRHDRRGGRRLCPEAARGGGAGR